MLYVWSCLYMSVWKMYKTSCSVYNMLVWFVYNLLETCSHMWYIYILMCIALCSGFRVGV